MFRARRRRSPARRPAPSPARPRRIGRVLPARGGLAPEVGGCARRRLPRAAMLRFRLSLLKDDAFRFLESGFSCKRKPNSG